jgi:copper(I)-binding protein
VTYTSLIPALILSAAIAAPACAHDYKIGPLQIAHPWTRATPKGAPVAGGYMKITNTGTAPDRLIQGSSEVSDRFEVHEMSMEGGVMKMRPIAGGLEIKPGQTVELKPGGLHVMFVGLKSQLQPDQQIKGTLVFEKAGKVDVEYKVEALGAQAPGGHAMPAGEMKHGH